MTNVQKVRESCTETDAHLRLEALKELLHRYRERAEFCSDCPLCDLGCTGCPWHLFTGGFCGDYRNKHFKGHFFGDYSARASDASKAWRRQRMRQLPKWIFAYEQALKNWRQHEV